MPLPKKTGSHSTRRSASAASASAKAKAPNGRNQRRGAAPNLSPATATSVIAAVLIVSREPSVCSPRRHHVDAPPMHGKPVSFKSRLGFRLRAHQMAKIC